MALQILNVNNSIDLQTGGGTAERTFQMSRQLARAGADCHVLTMAPNNLDDARVEGIAPAKLTVLPCLWRRYYVPSIAWTAIRDRVQTADIVHLMGHWSLLNALVYIAAVRAGKPYVVCPAGALIVFGRSQWLKKIFNVVIGNAIIRNADAWIAVTKAETLHFEAYGIARDRVTIIPNGVDESDFPEVDTEAFKVSLGLPLNARIILFMGRLNLIKGPDLLLEAFTRFSKATKDVHLVFAGPDGGMLAGLRATADSGNANTRIHFLGHVEGLVKVAAYRAAAMLVVPSRQEAMSIVAVEAGFCGTPALVTDQCGFNEVATVDARLETKATADALALSIEVLLGEDGLLEKLAPRWKQFVSVRFAWKTLVPRYLSLYQKLLAVRT